MELSKSARDLYLQGYNCSESILHFLKQNNILNVSDEILSALTGFRAGIAGNGCICGVVTASVLAIGLKYGSIDKKEVEKMTKIFYEKFKENYKSHCCRILTRKFKDNFNTKERREFCSEIVESMAKELVEILNN